MSEIDILGLDACLEPLYILLKDSSGFFVLFCFLHFGNFLLAVCWNLLPNRLLSL